MCLLVRDLQVCLTQGFSLCALWPVRYSPASLSLLLKFPSLGTSPFHADNAHASQTWHLEGSFPATHQPTFETFLCWCFCSFIQKLCNKKPFYPMMSLQLILIPFCLSGISLCLCLIFFFFSYISLYPVLSTESGKENLKLDANDWMNK